MKRLCECCGTADISQRHPRARYCLPCRNGGLVAFMPSKARNIVSTLVRAGLLTKPAELACTDCGCPATCYDHRDYLKPTEVEPVCNECNAIRGSAKNRFPWQDAQTGLVTAA
jgi:hypothetical protein